MDAAVGHQRNLVVNALSDRQPVQFVSRSTGVMYVLVESSASDEAFSTACRRPNSVRRSAVQDRVAVVHLTEQHPCTLLMNSFSDTLIVRVTYLLAVNSMFTCLGIYVLGPIRKSNAAFLSSRELVFTSSRPVKTRSIHVVSS